MARPSDTPKIAVVVRTYGNRPGEGEGIRVKMGTRFAVEIESDGLLVINEARYKRLRDGGLVRPFDPAKDAKAMPPPRARYADVGAMALRNQEAGAAPPHPPTAARAASRARTQDPAPAAPKMLAQVPAPDGSPTGLETPASSLPEAQASSMSSFRKRGTRRG